MQALFLLTSILSILKEVSSQVPALSSSDFSLGRFQLQTSPYYLNYSKTSYNPNSFSLNYPAGLNITYSPFVVYSLESIGITGSNTYQPSFTGEICFGLRSGIYNKPTQFQFILNSCLPIFIAKQSFSYLLISRSQINDNYFNMLSYTFNPQRTLPNSPQNALRMSCQSCLSPTFNNNGGVR